MTGRCGVCGVAWEDHHAPCLDFKFCCCLPLPLERPPLEAAGVYQPSPNGNGAHK